MKQIKAITFKDYLQLIKILDEKEHIIKLEKPPTIGIELNKIDNLKKTITILSYTGATIGEVHQMTVKELKQILSSSIFKNIVITSKGIHEITKVCSESFNNSSDTKIIRRYGVTNSSVNKNYLQTMTNKLLKELDKDWTTKGFKENILNVYGITEAINLTCKRLGVTKTYAKRLITKERVIFKIE